MKNQYLGDINDYKKYGLLRSIKRASGLRLLVAWMLTQDDESTDGNFTDYLHNRKDLSRHDPELFGTLKRLLASDLDRAVSLIEDTDLLADTDYFSEETPDGSASRVQWFNSLLEAARDAELVFLDPDNGLEVKSRPYGRKGSSKFLFWREVAALWSSGKSLLIYQHFIRENRVNFVHRMLEALRQVTPHSSVEAFSTSHVVFFMALQPKHQHFHEGIVRTVQDGWEGRIRHYDLVCSE